jgi:predicted O-methyltransferase YrrM
MTVLGKVAMMLPVGARDLAVRWRDRWRLARTPARCCDASRLARIDLAWLRQALAYPGLGAEWPGVAAEIERFQITTTAGGVNPGDRRALYYLVRAFRPGRVLEIGTHIGASTVHLAAALRTNAGSRGAVGDLTTVDIIDVNDPVTQPWLQFGSRLSPSEMIDQLGTSGRVRFVARSSLDFLADDYDTFDLIFLDGDHSAATVYRELPSALVRLNAGGLVVLHDYFPGAKPLWPGDPVIPGPWLAVRRLRREGVPIDVLPLGNLPWPTKLGLSVTSLAVVTGG